MELKQFGAWIGKQRKKRGLSKIEAARLCGVSQQYWHALERRGISPSVERADSILRGLGLSMTIGKQTKRNR